MDEYAGKTLIMISKEMYNDLQSFMTFQLDVHESRYYLIDRASETLSLENYI